MPVGTAVADGIGRIVLQQPPLNVLTRRLLLALREVLDRFTSDHAVRVLLLTAEGKHFSAGADVGEHLPPEHEKLIPEFLETVGAIEAFPLPVIAAVQGKCLGGGFELIQGADIILAAEGAAFGQPEIMLGVLPPAACALLPERCPPCVAAELLLTGEPLSAEEAARAGIVRHVVPAEELEPRALELCRKMARHSRVALRLTKRALRANQAVRTGTALHEAGRIYLDDLMRTKDAVEGLRAFTEKRAPAWSHR